MQYVVPGTRYILSAAAVQRTLTRAFETAGTGRRQRQAGGGVAWLCLERFGLAISSRRGEAIRGEAGLFEACRRT